MQDFIQNEEANCLVFELQIKTNLRSGLFFFNFQAHFHRNQVLDKLNLLIEFNFKFCKFDYSNSGFSLGSVKIIEKQFTRKIINICCEILYIVTTKILSMSTPTFRLENSIERKKKLNESFTESNASTWTPFSFWSRS